MLQSWFAAALACSILIIGCAKKSSQDVAVTSRDSLPSAPVLHVDDTDAKVKDTLAASARSVDTIDHQVAHWAHYVNEQYGFAFDYPDSLRVTKEFERNHYLIKKWRFNAISETGGSAAARVLVFKITNAKTYPRYYTVELRIGVSRDKKEMAACEKPGYNERAIGTINLGGTEFRQYEIEDAAMMQYVRGISYRVEHNAMCYAVEQLTNGSNYRETPNTADLPESVLKDQYFLAGKIVKTFRFTK